MNSPFKLKLITIKMSKANLDRMTYLREKVLLYNRITGYSPNTIGWQTWLRDVAKCYLFGLYNGSRLDGYAIMQQNTNCVLEISTTDILDINHIVNLNESNYVKLSTAINYIQSSLNEFNNIASKISHVKVAAASIKQKQLTPLPLVVTITTIESIVTAYNTAVMKLYK